MKIGITKGDKFITLKISHGGQVWHKFLLKDEYQLKAISNEILNFLETLNFLKPAENAKKDTQPDRKEVILNPSRRGIKT